MMSPGWTSVGWMYSGRSNSAIGLLWLVAVGGGSPCGGCRLLPPAGPPEAPGSMGVLDLADEEISERSERRRPAGENPVDAGGGGLAPGHQPQPGTPQQPR